jgi:hypothetical protein
MRRLGVLALAGILLSSASASAQEWQIKPFAGLTFGGGTTLFVDLEEASDDTHLVLGGSVTLIGEVLGIEGDFGYVPGFLGGDVLTVSSAVTTLTGNVVIALPRRMTEYTLRPYVVGGAGLMRVRGDDLAGAFIVTRHFVTMDVGGGVTGFLSDSIGLNWDLRYFRNVTGGPPEGTSLRSPRVSFWRLTMGVVVR